MTNDITEISWCRDASKTNELAAFFARHAGVDYISHSELQGPRALGEGRWRENLPEILEQEMTPRILAHQISGPDPVSQPILVAMQEGEIVALAFVTFAADAPVPYSILEDLIVAPKKRSLGIGKSVIDWVAEESKQRGIYRMFLESGVKNERAHHFFEREDFHICSVVMMRALK